MPAKTKASKLKLPSIIYDREPIFLLNSEEAAEYIGLPLWLIMTLFRDGKSPRHYLTGDKVDIYFDKETLDELRLRLGLDQREAANDQV